MQRAFRAMRGTFAEQRCARPGRRAGVAVPGGFAARMRARGPIPTDASSRTFGSGQLEDAATATYRLGMPQPTALGDYLRARRELLRPQDVGLPAGGRRR